MPRRPTLDSVDQTRIQRTLVCGSRSWGNTERIRQAVRRLPSNSVVVVGGARGADSIAEKIARECGLEVEVHVADWEKYGRSAGIRRNWDMLISKPDQVFAFWDGMSKGTQYTIDQARRLGIPVVVEVESASKADT